MQQPTINRIGPLSHLLRGRYQFFPEAAHAPTRIRVLANAHYLVLKIVAFVFYFILPSLALMRAMQAAQIVGAMRWLAWVGVVVASISLVQVMFMEILHVARVIRSGLGTKQP